MPQWQCYKLWFLGDQSPAPDGSLPWPRVRHEVRADVIQSVLREHEHGDDGRGIITTLLVHVERILKTCNLDVQSNGRDRRHGRHLEAIAAQN